MKEWNAFLKRIKKIFTGSKEEKEGYGNTVQLKFKAKDNKHYTTNCFSTEDLLRGTRLKDILQEARKKKKGYRRGRLLRLSTSSQKKDCHGFKIKSSQ
jgi:hypothetical protein